MALAGYYASYSRLRLTTREILGAKHSVRIDLGPGHWSGRDCSGKHSSKQSHPFEYFKTKAQLRAEGIGMRQKGQEMGVNFVRVFYQYLNAGYGFRHVYTG